MITILQILLILFAIFAWSRAALRLKKKDISLGGFIFWSLIWLTVIIFSSLPGILEWLSKILGIGRATDLAIYVSIVLLFYLLFRLYVRLDTQNQEITKLVREIAIKKEKKKK
ncbi:MAG: DUF2304 family protein [Candidatus Woesearchaeota archaeon]